jgi:ketosteroid isomerase-like protein
MILSWLASKILGVVFARSRAGDLRLALALDADDVELTFPGDSSWSGVFRGKQQLRPWLERFARVGIQLYADEVVAVGPPWNTTVCIRGHDILRGPDGELVYDNRAVLWCTLKWGRLKRYEVYEDTQKAKALDSWLDAHEQPVPVA